MYACETVPTTFIDETEILSVSLATTFRFSSQSVMTGIFWLVVLTARISKADRQSEAQRRRREKKLFIVPRKLGT